VVRDCGTFARLSGALWCCSLQRSPASKSAMRCRDIRAVEELLGDVGISATAIYTHMDFEYVAKIYRAAHVHAASIRRVAPVGANRRGVRAFQFIALPLRLTIIMANRS
jgi:hypothetical protein